MSFTAKGPYVSLGISLNVIGSFGTLAEAKRACAHDELAPCGQWKKGEDSFGVAYYANNGCEIVVGYDHPRVAKYSREEIEKATARFHWRESLR